MDFFKGYKLKALEGQVTELRGDLDALHGEVSTMIVPSPIQSLRGQATVDINSNFKLIELEAGWLTGYVNLADLSPGSGIEVTVMAKTEVPGRVDDPMKNHPYMIARVTRNEEPLTAVHMLDRTYLPDGGAVRVKHVSGSKYDISYGFVIH